MKIIEALNTAAGGKVKLFEKLAGVDPNGLLRWHDGELVSLGSIMSNNWQTAKLVGLCEACEEAGSQEKIMTTAMSNHLRKYHCTCKKEA